MGGLDPLLVSIYATPTFTSNVTIAGALSLGGNFYSNAAGGVFTISGTPTITGQLTVGGLTTGGGVTCAGLTVNGTAVVSSNLGVSGSFNASQGVSDAGYRVYSPVNPPPALAFEAALAGLDPGALLLLEVGAAGEPTFRHAVLGPPDDTGQRAVLVQGG
jgi:hypothetical protein